MKLEHTQLEQARRACLDEKRALAQMHAQMENVLKDILTSVEFIRKDGQRRLAEARTWINTQENRYRDAILTLQRFEIEGASKQPGDNQGSPKTQAKTGRKDGEEVASVDRTEAQRQLVEECTREVTRVCEHFGRTEQEVHETEKRLSQKKGEAKNAEAVAKRWYEKACLELKYITRVFDEVEKLLQDYEGARDD